MNEDFGAMLVVLAMTIWTIAIISKIPQIVDNLLEETTCTQK